MAAPLTNRFSEKDLKKIYEDSLTAFQRVDSRGLVQSGKWLSELALSLEHHIDKRPALDCPQEVLQHEYTKHAVAKSYYTLQEYQRAQHLLRECDSPATSFLHYYCRYLASETEQSQNEAAEIVTPEETNEGMTSLFTELRDRHQQESLDGFMLYLYGVVLKKQGFKEDARNILLSSVSKEPCLWAAWLELSALIDDHNDLASLTLPDHWMKSFFLGHTYLSLQHGDQAVTIYSGLSESGFDRSSYVTAQLAVAYFNMNNIDMAIGQFEVLREVEPYRLDDMDAYSNALFVKEMTVELSDLAARCLSLDKYRPETCCVIGNYYSVRGQHQQAVVYFQRALKLNSEFIAAWTLMGHEYMEMGNKFAAIRAYRKALDVDSRDFRAWYGLGQTHEMLKMHHYSLHYFQQALRLRPNDSRMLMAVGCAYQKLNKPQEAKICFWKAHMLGDPEGVALCSLAKLHEELGEDENAAAAFTNFVLENIQHGMADPKEMAHAYKYLANYMMKIGNYEEAYIAAQKCIDYPETREEGKSLLNQITQSHGIPGELVGLDRTLPPDDSLMGSLLAGQAHTPAPHLSPVNLNFTPDH